MVICSVEVFGGDVVYEFVSHETVCANVVVGVVILVEVVWRILMRWLGLLMRWLRMLWLINVIILVFIICLLDVVMVHIKKYVVFVYYIFFVCFCFVFVLFVFCIVYLFLFVYFCVELCG